MGTITPNSTIYLLKGVPLDNTYANTVSWTGNTALEKQTTQRTTFLQHFPHIDISSHSYQRVEEGVLRINAPVSTIYDCNYMLFCNSGLVNNQPVSQYENKWYYAFINNVEFVNEQATNIYYEIDVIQTWFAEMQLQPSLVIREHSATDAIGDNLVPEDIDYGDVICADSIETDWFDDYAAVICYADVESNEDEQDSEGGEE